MVKEPNEFWVNEYNIGDIIRVPVETRFLMPSRVCRVCVIHAHKLIVNYRNESNDMASGRLVKADIVRVNHPDDIKQFAVDMLTVNRDG